jgi:hypothetical protein
LTNEKNGCWYTASFVCILTRVLVKNHFDRKIRYKLASWGHFVHIHKKHSLSSSSGLDGATEGRGIRREGNGNRGERGEGKQRRGKDEIGEHGEGIICGK